jgi:hypothetical protein
MGRYTILELPFVPEFHTGTHQHMLYPFIVLHFSDGISLSRFYLVDVIGRDSERYGGG